MRKLILFTLLVAWPSAALSQQIYGRLEGAANDAQGLVLPGVTVTLESEELVAPRGPRPPTWTVPTGSRSSSAAATT